MYIVRRKGIRLEAMIIVGVWERWGPLAHFLDLLDDDHHQSMATMKAPGQVPANLDGMLPSNLADISIRLQFTNIDCACKVPMPMPIYP